MTGFSQIYLNSNNSPFRFNAKELDATERIKNVQRTFLAKGRACRAERNYYYGARYGVYPEHSRRDPKWSILALSQVEGWISVDPSAELMPEWSSYAYTFNNPVNFTDPTGMIGEGVENEYHVYTKNGEVTRVEQVGDKGGDETDYITVFDEDVSPVFKEYKTEVEVDLVNPENNSSVAENTFFALGAVASYKRYSGYSKFLNIWRGKNGKLYHGLSGRGPNQYTGSRGAAQSRAKKIGAGGAFLGGLSMLAYEDEYRNSRSDYGPNMQRHLDNRRLLDQSANATGFLGILGATFSTGYNLGHFIEGVCNCNIQYNPLTRDFTPIEETLMMYDRLGIDLNKQ